MPSPDLVPLLAESASKIQEYWGVNTEFKLRLVNDPDEPGEDADSWVLYIASSDPDAHAILDRFDEEWWLDHMRGKGALYGLEIRRAQPAYRPLELRGTIKRQAGVSDRKYGTAAETVAW